VGHPRAGPARPAHPRAGPFRLPRRNDSAGHDGPAPHGRAEAAKRAPSARDAVRNQLDLPRLR